MSVPGTACLNRPTPRLLYLEDEVMLALGVAFMLSQDGRFDVVLAHNLRAAEAVLAEQPIDLLLFDIQISPAENSLDLAQRLRRQGRPILLTSGLAAVPGDWPADLPLPPFIEKPFHMGSLADRLHATLALA